MPPPKSHKKITTAQKETLKLWIADGAKYEKHWAFIAVTAVKVPTAVEIPKANAELLKWPKNPIDWFILQTLTQGYQNDRDQDMYPFRDWVIAAFNKNMRFDQFTIEQLAGDLLPGATLEQKIATGFHRNHRVNTEGGVIPAEFVAEYTADRVETTAEVWLGQTFNCTRCHDHKFDPFTQRDFYSMKAFFSNVGEQGEGALDTVTLSSPELENKIAPLQKEVVALQEKLSKQKVTDTDIRVWAGSPCRTRRRA